MPNLYKNCHCQIKCTPKIVSFANCQNLMLVKFVHKVNWFFESIIYHFIQINFQKLPLDLKNCITCCVKVHVHFIVCHMCLYIFFNRYGITTVMYIQFSNYNINKENKQLNTPPVWIWWTTPDISHVKDMKNRTTSLV